MGKIGKRHKKITSRNVDEHAETQQIVYRADDGSQDYGYVRDSLGSCRFNVACNDGKARIGILRGNMRKRVWITKGDLVLFSVRDFEDDKVDVIHKYTSCQVKSLAGELSKELAALYAGSSAYASVDGGETTDQFFAFEDGDEQLLTSDLIDAI